MTNGSISWTPKSPGARRFPPSRIEALCLLAKDEKEARDLLRSWFPSNIPQFALTVEEVYPIDEARVIYASKPEQR